MWLADAVWTTGTAEVPERDLPVNPDEAPTVLEREVFEGRDVAAADTRRAEVANAIVESYLARRPATEAFATALARDVAERHLTVVATRGRERRILERLGADGAPEPPGQPPLAVTWSTVVDNQAAIFTEREISHRVMLDLDGSAKVRTIVTLTNHADDAPPSALLGFPLPATVPDPAGVNPVGGWAADVGVLLPAKADRVTAETSVPSETSIAEEEGRAVVLAQLAVDPGDSRSLLVGYRLPDAKIDDGEFRLRVIPQPAWPVGLVRVRIDAPPGEVIAEASQDLEVGGVSATYVGRPTRPFTLWIRID
jgi:hypothetical protein